MSQQSAVIAPRFARPLYAANLVVAGFGVLVSLTLNLSGYYVGDIDPSKPTILGNVPGGIDTPVERFFDWITYFTLWSNIVVVVVMAALVFKPALFTSQTTSGFIWRTLRLDSVLMIVVTGVIFNLLLATGEKTGWDFVSNSFLHIITPIVTPLVWLLAGPRGWINVRVVAASLVLPLVWAAFALTRGAVIGAYPYPFLDVAANGLASVLTFIAVMIIVAVILNLVMLLFDVILRRAFFRVPTEAVA